MALSKLTKIKGITSEVVSSLTGAKRLLKDWVGLTDSLSGGIKCVNDIESKTFTDGQVVQLVSWHVGLNKGGGVLVFDANRPKSDHNGGTVFSPTVPRPSDQANIGDYLSGVGETDPGGNGCIVRNYVEYVTPLMFGALTDFDISAQLNKALNSSEVVFIDNLSDFNYVLDDQVNFKSGNFLKSNGANIAIRGSWVVPAFSGINVDKVKINGINFLGNNHTSSSSVINLSHNSSITGGDKLKGPEIKNCSFSGFDSYGVLLINNEIITGSDWLEENEPPSTWKTYENTVCENLSFMGNTVPVETKAQPSLALSGLRGVNISKINIDKDEERGISVGYSTDVKIGNCSIKTKSNLNAGSNAHCIYLRTTKRFNISESLLGLDENVSNAFLLRLSRGVYFGSISGVSGVAEGSTSNGGGLGMFGVVEVNVSSCYFKSPINTLSFSGHASADGSSGYSDESFADCRQLSITSSSFYCTSDQYAVYANAVSVPLTEPIQPNYTGISISDCKFRNIATNCVQVGRLNIGDNARMDNCKFSGVKPEVGLEINRDSRIPNSEFSWSINNCSFDSDTRVITSNPSATFGPTFTTCAVLFFGNSGSNSSYITNCNFSNWFMNIGNNSGEVAIIEDNTFKNCLLGYRLNTASGYLSFNKNKIYGVSDTGGILSIYGDVSKGSIMGNNTEAQAAYFARFSTTNTITGLNISHNTYRGLSKFLRDTPDVSSINVTHNLVDEAIASDKPANPNYQFNEGL